METEISIGLNGTLGTMRPKTPDHQLQAAAALSPSPVAPQDNSTSSLASDAHGDAHKQLTAKPPKVAADTRKAFQQTKHSHDPEQILVQSTNTTAETSSTIETHDALDEEARSHSVNSQVDCGCHICREYAHLAQKLLKKLDDEAKEKEESKKNNEEDGQHLPECLCRKCLTAKLHQLGKDQPDFDIISYAVEYLDRGNIPIKEEPWPHSFNLAASRILPGKHLRKGITVFSVTTILATSVAANPYRPTSEVDRVMEVGVLQNPGMRVVVKGTRLRIYSRAIMNALRSVVAYYPGVSLWHDEAEIREPFCIIAHHLDALKSHQASLCCATGTPACTETCEKLSVPQAVEHLSMLFKHIEGIYKGRLEQEKERYKRGLCTFHMLWYLYKPGETVYVRDDQGDLSALIIQKVEVDPSILYDSVGGRAAIVVSLWHLDYNGQEVGRCSKVVRIDPFQGEKEIMTLDLFPCKYQDNIDGGKAQADLIKYGRRWYKYLAVDQMQYSGRLWNSENREVNGRVVSDWTSYWEYQKQLEIGRKDKQARAIIDKMDDIRRIFTDVPALDREMNPEEDKPKDPDVQPIVGKIDDDSQGYAIPTCHCRPCSQIRDRQAFAKSPWEGYDSIFPEKLKTLDDQRYLLCPRRLCGLILKSRTWAQFDIACCSDVKTNDDTFNSLVLQDPRTMGILKALVFKYGTGESSGNKAATKAWSADFIENKGEGQIFLLHGSPGVGKTYTAECIAEHTKRPLLSLTAADIGVDATEMEKLLSSWFRLGEKWGAVMLIDEADVFLERRSSSDIKRNGLVSVFLRSIEYYCGILFLTSNRVAQFDDAFTSRIHVVIHYPPLKREQRKRIWKNFFDKLQKDRDNVIVKPRARSYILNSSEILDEDWNGREIRNVFQTAVAIAQYRAIQERGKVSGNEEDGNAQEGFTLDQSDFEEVCEMTREFKQYLIKANKGQDQETRAFVGGARNDLDNGF